MSMVEDGLLSQRCVAVKRSLLSLRITVPRDLETFNLFAKINATPNLLDCKLTSLSPLPTSSLSYIVRDLPNSARDSRQC